MLATTGSYQELQEKEKRLANDLSLAQAQLFPLRKENSRLIKENNQLHVNSVQKADEHDELIAKNQLATKLATDEVNELKIVSKLKDEQLQRKDKELERLRDVSSSCTTEVSSLIADTFNCRLMSH